MSKAMSRKEMGESFEKGLVAKPFLTQARKVHGQVVEAEIEVPSFKEDEALDTLLDGVGEDEIEEGREKWAEINPRMASEQMNDFMDRAADSISEDMASVDPVKEAGVKRAGLIMDRESGDSLNFKRIAGGSQVELTDEDGGVLDTLASNEFDELLGSGEYVIL